MSHVTKIRRGVYRHEPSDQLVVRTDGWDGPRGGDLKFWEIATIDSNGEIVIDGWLPFRRLRDAVASLDQRS